jgi:hypothetical protein
LPGAIRKLANYFRVVDIQELSRLAVRIDTPTSTIRDLIGSVK